MSDPHVPTDDRPRIELPCETRIRPDALDMGMREYHCGCGDAHAVVMDVHPLGRWIPESVGTVLAETVEPTDEYDEFNTVHLMGLVLEEYPERVAVHDASDDPALGWAIAWVTSFDARTLHRIVVELLVELMDHAVGHARDTDLQVEFDDQLSTFDVDEFVDAYRAARNFGVEGDTPP